MTHRHYWLVVVFSVLFSFSYLLWSWHDQTCADCSAFGWRHVMREQTRPDRAAAIGYAIARVVLTMWLLELVPRAGGKA